MKCDSFREYLADRYNERVLGGFPARVLGTLTFVRPAETFR